jgi:hypothetical protein
VSRWLAVSYGDRVEALPAHGGWDELPSLIRRLRQRDERSVEGMSARLRASVEGMCAQLRGSTGVHARASAGQHGGEPASESGCACTVGAQRVRVHGISTGGVEVKGASAPAHSTSTMGARAKAGASAQ